MSTFVELYNKTSEGSALRNYADACLKEHVEKYAILREALEKKGKDDAVEHLKLKVDLKFAEGMLQLLARFFVHVAKNIPGEKSRKIVPGDVGSLAFENDQLTGLIKNAWSAAYAKTATHEERAKKIKEDSKKEDSNEDSKKEKTKEEFLPPSFVKTFPMLINAAFVDPENPLPKGTISTSADLKRHVGYFAFELVDRLTGIAVENLAKASEMVGDADHLKKRGSNAIAWREIYSILEKECGALLTLDISPVLQRFAEAKAADKGSDKGSEKAEDEEEHDADADGASNSKKVEKPSKEKKEKAEKPAKEKTDKPKKEKKVESDDEKAETDDDKADKPAKEKKDKADKPKKEKKEKKEADA